MAKRKMKVSFTKKESVALHCLFGNLFWGREGLREAVGIDKTTKEMYDDIFEKFFVLFENTFPPEVDPIYEMTGGYLGDGVWITPDGHLYDN